MAVREYPLHLIPLDGDVLSLETPCFGLTRRVNSLSRSLFPSLSLSLAPPPSLSPFLYVSIYIYHSLEPVGLIPNLFPFLQAGVYNHVTVREYPLHLIPLDGDVLSLETPCFRSLYLDGDHSELHTIAASILQLENLYGTIGTIRGKGACSQQVARLLHQVGYIYTLIHIYILICIYRCICIYIYTSLLYFATGISLRRDHRTGKGYTYKNT